MCSLRTFNCFSWYLSKVVMSSDALLSGAVFVGTHCTVIHSWHHVLMLTVCQWPGYGLLEIVSISLTTIYSQYRMTR